MTARLPTRSNRHANVLDVSPSGAMGRLDHAELEWLNGMKAFVPYVSNERHELYPHSSWEEPVVVIDSLRTTNR